MMWAALYQQRPAPEEGDYFKAAWLKPYDTLPARETLRVYGASDYAVTADGGDFTVHIVVGLDPEGRMYLIDLWRKQTASDEWIEAFCNLVMSGSQLAGQRRRDRSVLVLVPLSIGVSESARHIPIDNPFPREGIRQLERNQSAAGWLLKVFTYPRMRVGTLVFDPNC
jgi:hypothetical protein